jgi:hypothetical protein
MDIQENHKTGYVGEMSAELAEIARHEGRFFLAYLLEMASAEASRYARGRDLGAPEMGSSRLDL